LPNPEIPPLLQNKNGLLPESEYSETYARTGHPCKTDFITFGTRIGVPTKKLDLLIGLFSQEHPLIYDLIERSFLDDKAKRMYKRSYQERLSRFLRNDVE